MTQALAAENAACLVRVAAFEPVTTAHVQPTHVQRWSIQPLYYVE